MQDNKLNVAQANQEEVTKVSNLVFDPEGGIVGLFKCSKCNHEQYFYANVCETDTNLDCPGCGKTYRVSLAQEYIGEGDSTTLQLVANFQPL